MKEYKQEIIAVTLIFLSYFLAKTFFFSMESASYLENVFLKNALVSMYETRDFSRINDYRLIYMPIFGLLLFLYPLIGKSRKKLLIITAGYLLLFLFKPIIEYNFISGNFLEGKASFSYIKYLLLISLCGCSAYLCNKIHIKKLATSLQASSTQQDLGGQP